MTQRAPRPNYFLGTRCVQAVNKLGPHHHFSPKEITLYTRQLDTSKSSILYNPLYSLFWVLLVLNPAWTTR